MTHNSSGHIGAFNLAIVLALCFGSLTYGYSFSVTTTTLGQASFFTYFDLSRDATSPKYAYTNRIIGGLNGCFSGGGFLGSLLGGWACDALGRKKTLLLATPIAIVGGALQGGSVHLAMLLIGRSLGGIAVGILMVLIPLFQCEIAPPATRGFLVSQHGVVLVFGYAIAAWVGFGCFYATKSPGFQWRFPLCLQCLWPLVMLALTPVIPESPRWRKWTYLLFFITICGAVTLTGQAVLMQGKREESWRIMQRLHNSTRDTSRISFAQEEFYQMSYQVTVDQNRASSETVSTLFTRPSYRKRMFCAFMTMFATESTAILVIYNYSILLYEGLGFTSSISLLLAALYVTVACCGNYINSLLVDRLGRVKLLVIGLSGCLLSLIFEAALSASYIGTNNHPGLSAGVFFLFLFVAFYGCCLDATSYVYCTEIFPTHIRSRGMAWSLAILFASTIAYLIPAPTAFAQVQWKYYLLFIILTAINIPVVWFYFPETKGLALEEVGEKFGDEVAVHLTRLTSEQREELDKAIESEKNAPGSTHIDQVAA